MKKTYLKYIFAASIFLSIPFQICCGDNQNNQFEQTHGNYLLVLDKDKKEFESLGSYELRIYQVLDKNNPYADLITGTIEKRDGAIVTMWIIPNAEKDSFAILVWIRSAGSGAYGTLERFIFHDSKLKKSDLPKLSKEQFKDYMGHDIFKVVENRIYRLFPKYKPNDSNAKPTGGQASYLYNPSKNQWENVNIEIEDE